MGGTTFITIRLNGHAFVIEESDSTQTLSHRYYVIRCRDHPHKFRIVGSLAHPTLLRFMQFHSRTPKQEVLEALAEVLL